MLLVFLLVAMATSAKHCCYGDPSAATGGSYRCPVSAPCTCDWHSVTVISETGYGTSHAIDCFDKSLTDSTTPEIRIGNVSIVSMNMSRNLLTDLPDGYFASLRQDLQKLDMSANRLRYIPNSVKTLRSLVQLSLKNNNIDLGKTDFIQLQRLKYLDLSGNAISRTSRDTFLGLSALVYLYLDDNRIQTIGEHSFWTLHSLQLLNLTNNRVEAATSDAFSGLYWLQLLALRNNQLIKLRDGTFQNMKFLTSLDVSRNRLSSIEAGAFRDATALQFLDLEENQLSFLASGVFKGLDQLEHLLLARNRFSEINRTAFKDVEEKLTRLDLSLNLFTEFPAGFFDGFKRLLTLQLDFNKLTRVPDVQGLVKLTALTLFGTSISTIYECELQPLHRLNHLWWANVDDMKCDCNVRWLRARFEHSFLEVEADGVRARMLCQAPLQYKGLHFLDDLNVDNFTCSAGQEASFCFPSLANPNPDAHAQQRLLLAAAEVRGQSAVLTWQLSSPSVHDSVYGIEVVCEQNRRIQPMVVLHLPASAREYVLRDLDHGTCYSACVKAYGVTAQTVARNCTTLCTLGISAESTSHRPTVAPFVEHRHRATSRTTPVLLLVPILLVLGLAVFVLLALALYYKVRNGTSAVIRYNERVGAFSHLDESSSPEEESVSVKIEGDASAHAHAPVLSVSQLQMTEESLL